MKFSLNSEGSDPIEILFIAGSSQQTRIISFPDETFAITHNEKVAFLYNNEMNQTSSDYVFNAENNVEIKEDFQVQDIYQWKLYIFEDFQSPIDGWSKDTVSTCGNNGNLFLGGHCNFGNDFVYKIFQNLPQHKMVEFSYFIYI